MLTGPSSGPKAGGKPDSVVTLLHGLGADGNDLIGLAPVLATALPRTLFVAPNAPYPCDMAPYGRQWFSLQDRRPTALLAATRRAAPQLDQYLDALQARHQLAPGKMALIGFSQGTMMALFVAVRRAQSLAAVVGFSGALVGAEQLAQEVRSRPPVLLIHGDADDVVPVEAMQVAVEALGGAEIPVQWLRRPGLPHSIDEVGIAAAAKFLSAMLEAA